MAKTKKGAIPTRKGQPEWLPQSYTLENGWIYHRPDKETKTKVCSSFEPIGLLRDNRGEGWSYLIRFTDDDGRMRVAVINRSKLHGKGNEVRQYLMNLGMVIALASREHPFDRLLLAIPKEKISRVLLVNRPGWTGDCFVAPDGEVIAPDGAEPVHYPAAATGQKSGRPETQIEAARLAFSLATGEAGNDLYALAGLMGAAGCVVDRAELDASPVANFAGLSTKGKSSAAAFGASVFGNPKLGCQGGGMQPLGGTAPSMEVIAEQRTGTALFLDEPATADKKRFNVVELVFMLASCAGKTRNKQGDTNRPTRSWRTFVALSAEFSIRQLAEHSGQHVTAGLAVRAVEIDATRAMPVSDEDHRRLMQVRENYGHLGGMIAAEVMKSFASDLRLKIEDRARDLAGERPSAMAVRAASVLAILWVTGDAYHALGLVTEEHLEALIRRTWTRFIKSDAATWLDPMVTAADSLKHALFTRIGADVRALEPMLKNEGGLFGDDRNSRPAVAYYNSGADGTTFYVPVPELVKLANTSLPNNALRDYLIQRGILVPGGEKNIAYSAIKAIPVRHYRLFYKQEDELGSADAESVETREAIDAPPLPAESLSAGSTLH